MLRYHQNRGELGAPNGSADPGALNQFLTNYCPTDAKGKQICDGFLCRIPHSGEQVVNLWRAAEFTGAADVEVARRHSGGHRGPVGAGLAGAAFARRCR